MVRPHFDSPKILSPMFVFPIPKQNGFLSMFCQMIPSPLNASEDHCKFTALEEFQRKGANAITYLDMVYYTELMESKGTLCGS